ncbi:MAG: DNA gyrase inhibitor YacG [Alphaproteobacteria bacterium]|nr:DNA gyrase inhibitor YacG [Alphaproteobacteria bacterium]
MSNDRDTVTRLPNAGGTCPTCGKPSVPRYRPFCSGRCSDIDLGRWLKESYRVETDEDPADPSEDERP